MHNTENFQYEFKWKKDDDDDDVFMCKKTRNDTMVHKMSTTTFRLAHWRDKIV